MKWSLNSIPKFTLLMVLSICCMLGISVLPLLDVEPEPRPEQGKVLSVSFRWPDRSAKVVEQNVTSRIEACVSSVIGVESVSSVSEHGSGRVDIQLKKKANVSSVKFEVASVLKQLAKGLPDGVSHLELNGGEVVTQDKTQDKSLLLLTYQLHANITDEQLKEYAIRHIEPKISRMEGVVNIDVIGGRERYIEVTYDPVLLSAYELTSKDIYEAINHFIGTEQAIGQVQNSNTNGPNESLTLYLGTKLFDKDLSQLPITTAGDKTVYLNDLATYDYKWREPDRYYRINGLSTIYLNVYVASDASRIRMSRKLRSQMDDLSKKLRRGIHMQLEYDASAEGASELQTLIARASAALLFLLVLIRLLHRSWRYLTVIGVTLAANLLIAAIVYFLADLRLHTFSLAGLTVSLGVVIDASIVMVNHYCHYRNRRAFIAILGAILTTIGSLVIVFFMPEHIRHDLGDFSRVIIVNLSVSLIVSAVFVPTLCEVLLFKQPVVGDTQTPSRLPSAKSGGGIVGGLRTAFWWNHFYRRYIYHAQRRRWLWTAMLILAFGIPFHALPSHIALPDEGGNASLPSEGHIRRPGDGFWASLYNTTIGSSTFQREWKEPLSKVFGGSLYLFAKTLHNVPGRSDEDHSVVLHISGQMPLGGTPKELNQKVMIIERFIQQYGDKLERVETTVDGSGALIHISFKKEYEHTSFPYDLESRIIGQLLTIGGADWCTYGVSQRGFSNSLNLQYRNYRFALSGYEYDRLYSYAEELASLIAENPRVQDITVETPGQETQPDELFVQYNREAMARSELSPSTLHAALQSILAQTEAGHYRDNNTDADIVLRSERINSFDLWALCNTFVRIDSVDLRPSDYMTVARRKANNVIPRHNQEYVLQVAFNLLAPPAYINKYLSSTADTFNHSLPIGYKCKAVAWGWNEGTSTQYWLLALIAIVIYAICAVLFESLTLPLLIVSLIPASFIGAFLVFALTGVAFGTGGFASLVLLSGLVVNAGIYLIDEYLSLRRAHNSADCRTLYIRAYNHKIVPVLLTVVSTLLGLLPFLWGEDKQSAFWFSFAVGSMGGLVASIIAFIFVTPILLNLQSTKKISRDHPVKL